MTGCSVQFVSSVSIFSRIFIKGYGFLSFVKNLGGNIGKNISKSLSVNIPQNFLIMPHILRHMHLNFLQKESFKKQQKQLVI